jgi:TM2 domain-containing membrane protein YozV
VSDQWFYSRDGRQYGPVPTSELKSLAASGVVLPSDYVWREGMTNWALATQVEGIFEPGAAPPPPPTAPLSRGDVSNKRITAGVLGLLLGSLGVHKFVLGMTGPGLILLLSTICTCFIGSAVTSIIGLIEGIIYLSKSDEDFYRDYIVNKKPWF